MDLHVVSTREHYVNKVAVDSEYEKHHAAAVMYCDKFKCKADRGIRLAREEDPECWPGIITNSLWRALIIRTPGDFVQGDV
jgi:hypothetical protein